MVISYKSPGYPEEEERMKTLLRRLAIMAAPIVWRKIKERRRGGHHGGGHGGGHGRRRGWL